MARKSAAPDGRRVSVWGRRLRWALGLGLLAYVVAVVDLAVVWSLVSGADFPLLLLCLLGYFACQILGAVKIHVLLRASASVPFLTVLRSDMLATSLGYFTPGSVGAPISLALSLGRESVARAVTAAVFLLDKAVTTLVVVALACAGLHDALRNAEVAAAGGGGGRTWIVGAAVIAGTGVALVLARQTPVFRRLREMAGHLGGALLLYRVRPWNLLCNVVITVAAQIVWALYWSATFMAIGQKVSFLLLVTTVPAIALVGYLPISVGGLGAQELAAIHLWEHAGISSNQALAAFALSRALTLVSALLLIGALSRISGRHVSGG